MNQYKGATKGDLFSDSYGNFKFREVDEFGAIKQNQYLDENMPRNQSYHLYSGKFESAY